MSFLSARPARAALPFAVSAVPGFAPRFKRRPAAVRVGRDRTALGILAILGSTISFPISDLCAKSLMTSLPPLEVTWLRYMVFVVLVLPLLGRGRAAFASARPGLQVVRGILSATATVAALLAFGFMPVAETTAIGFVAPVFVTALAALVLKERVGIHRWGAALVALGGVMLVVQPGGASFKLISLLPLAGALGSAGSVICTRLIKADDSRTTVLYTTLVGAAILTVLVVPGFVMPARELWPTILVVGLFGALGTVLQVVGYRLAAASVLSPFTYTQLIWASAFSFLVFGSVPGPAMVAGSLVIAGSAIYIGWRERVRGVA